MELNRYSIELALTEIAGGYPGSIDAQRAFLQNPMMARRVPESAREEFLAREREWGLPEHASANGDESPDVIRTGFRRDADGLPYLGAYQIKACLQQAARNLYDTTSRPTIYQVARAITYGIEVLPRDIPIQGGRDGGVRQIAQIIEHPRNPQIRVPSTRERQLWLGGTLTFAIVVQTRGASGKVLTEDLIGDLFETAGTFVGLGTDRGYGHGRFEVARLDGPELIDSRAVRAADVDLANPARKGIGYVRADKR